MFAYRAPFALNPQELLVAPHADFVSEHFYRQDLTRDSPLGPCTEHVLAVLDFGALYCV